MLTQKEITDFFNQHKDFEFVVCDCINEVEQIVNTPEKAFEVYKEWIEELECGSVIIIEAWQDPNFSPIRYELK